MRMIRFVTAASAATFLAAAGLAADAAPQRFTRDGRTYVYTLTPRDDGSTLIEGHALGRGGRFRLVIDGERVRGVSNGMPVSFTRADATRIAAATRID